MELLIKNGLFVTSEQVMEADLWIRDGKIHRFQPSIHPQKDIEQIDGTPYVVLPGMLQREAGMSDNKTELEKRMRSGATTAIKEIYADPQTPIERLLSEERKQYEQHPLDLLFTVRIPFYSLNARRMIGLKKAGIGFIKILIHEWKDLYHIKWSEVAEVLRHWSAVFSVGYFQEAKEESIKEWEGKAEAIAWLCSVYGLKAVVEAAARKQLAFLKKIVRSLDFQPSSGMILNIASSWLHTYAALQQSLRWNIPAVCLEGEIHRPWPRPDLPLLVKCSMINPAKIYGVYPKKGSFCIGSDADMMMVRKDWILTETGNESNLESGDTVSPDLVMHKGRWVKQEKKSRMDFDACTFLNERSHVGYMIFS